MLFPFLGLLSAASPADAASAPPVAVARLEVQALPDCTSREELEARVAARSRRIRFDDDAAGPILRAVIAPAPRGGAVGELLITEPGGKTSSRRISAPSCAEATDAIALIVALTLDPTSGAGNRTAGAGPAASLPPPTASSASAETAATSAEPAHAPATRSAPPAAGERAGKPERPSREPEPTVPPPDSASAVAGPALPVPAVPTFGAGVGGQAIVGAAPAVLPGVTVYLLAALDRASLWSPAAVLWGTHATTSGLVESGGTAAFTLDALTLDACALRVHLSAFEARACASALYGRLAASGSETYSPAAAARPYLVGGGALLLSARIARLFELSARLGGGASLVRDSFAFSPKVFHRTAAATLSAGLAIGLRFP